MNPAIALFWQRYGLTTMLGAAALSLVGAMGVETGWGNAIRPPLPKATGGPHSPETLATMPAFQLPPLDIGFKETADRPLFTPTRRPAAVNLAANTPAMKKGQFKLNGTSVSNELALAFLFEMATGKTVRITKGKEINGMTLETVEAGRIVLKQGEETEELTLRTAASPPVPPKPATPTPVPGTVPANSGAPSNPQPVATVNVGAVPRPLNLPQSSLNPFVPAPGSSQLPGFVMPSAIAPPPAGVTLPSEPGSPPQRRRRFQNVPPGESP